MEYYSFPSISYTIDEESYTIPSTSYVEQVGDICAIAIADLESNSWFSFEFVLGQPIMATYYTYFMKSEG